jgi:phosphoglycerate dehydrogenase-like enzyme
VFSSPGVLPTEKELIELLPGCVGYLAGVETISAAVLESASELKVISRNGTGIDNIDLAAAERLSISVCRAIGANARGVAELTIALMLALSRSILYSDAAIKRGKWERRKGIEVASRTLGIIGCGNIGRLVAEFALALGMEVIGHDVAEDCSFAPSDRFRYASLDDLLAQADVISIHCPSQPTGEPLIDQAAFSRMKDGVLLINTARPDLVDTAALAACLESGRVAGAALDVFDVDPPADSPLAKHDRVIATPHIGGFTEESIRRAVEVAVANLLENLK